MSDEQMTKTRIGFMHFAELPDRWTEDQIGAVYERMDGDWIAVFGNGKVVAIYRELTDGERASSESDSYTHVYVGMFRVRDDGVVSELLEPTQQMLDWHTLQRTKDRYSSREFGVEDHQRYLREVDVVTERARALGMMVTSPL